MAGEAGFFGKLAKGFGPMGMIQAGLGIGQAAAGLIGMGKAQRAADAAVDAIDTLKPSQEIAGIYQGAKLRSTKGLSGAARALAKQGSAAATSSAMRRAQDRKAGLAMTGATTAAEQDASLKLAEREDAAQRQSQASLVQAAGMSAADAEKVQKSRQEKQSLKANIAMQKVAAKKQMVSQGLAGITGAASNAMTSGKSTDLAARLAAMGIVS